MKIIIYTDGNLTPAQFKMLEAFESVVVQPLSAKNNVLVTVTTFQDQHIQATIDESGIIQALGFGPRKP